MADNKTVFRELSVLYGLTKLFENSTITGNYHDFFEVVKKYAANSNTFKFIEGDNYLITTNIHTIINGLEIAKGLIEVLNLKKAPEMIWVGEDTQSDIPVDIYVNNIGISLKEDSFILENMGLYKMVNILTGSAYSRGSLHIFKTFSPDQYNLWFKTTWELLVDQLQIEKAIVILSKNNTYKSKLSLKNNNKVILMYDGTELDSTVELPTETNLDVYEELTNSLIREKVFAKWINTYISNNVKYLSIKKNCAVAAGRNLTKVLRGGSLGVNLARLFRIYDKAYLYAKASNGKVDIYEIPALSTFTNNFKLSRLEYSVPSSQLNFYTEVSNSAKGNSITFRNEIRFSHGQFNGTPEAKLYIERGSLLETIYNQIYSRSYQYAGH